MSDAEGVSESGGSNGPDRDEGVSEETEAAVEEAMSGEGDGPATDAETGTASEAITEEDARATQERMEAEGRAARESYQRQEQARADAAGYADAMDQETAAANAAAEAAAYADALEQEVAYLNENLPVEFEDVALEPTLREQMLSDPEAIQDPSDLAELDAFLDSDAGIAAARQYEFDHALQTSELTPDQVTQAMGHFTAGRDLVYDEHGQITTLEDGTVAYEVLVADANGGFDAIAEGDPRSAAEIAADYARGLNETVAAVANSSWGWAAGLAFDAVALAAGGPVRFAVNMAAGEGAAAILEQGLEAGANYLAEHTGMEADDIAHLAIAGGTILGGAVLGWRGVKEIARNLPDKLDDLMGAVRRFRDDESGSVPGPTRRGAFTGDLDRLSEAERSFVERELAAGRNVEAIPTGPDRTPDFRIDDQPVELKTLENIANQTSDGLSGAISSRVLDARGQSGHVVIDGTTQPGLTEAIAERAVSRAYGADRTQGIESIRIIGPDFDITVPRRAD